MSGTIRTSARLIITSDDFGAAVAVNEAVEQAHRYGALTAASLMVTGPALADAVKRARRLPSLGVGLHLMLVDGIPALPPEHIPLLVDARGRFRDDMARAGLTIFARPAARAQLRAEIAAQFAAFAATGLPLDHVNAHKHFHVHPTIAATVLAVGRRYAMRAVRAPIEPGGGVLVNAWARLVRRRMRRAGMIVPDRVIGLRWSGAFDTERLRAATADLPPGLTEIYMHPATATYPGSAPGYRYAEELAALTDARVLAQVRNKRVTLGRFADFVRAPMP